MASALTVMAGVVAATLALWAEVGLYWDRRGQFEDDVLWARYQHERIG